MPSMLLVITFNGQKKRRVKVNKTASGEIKVL